MTALLPKLELIWSDMDRAAATSNGNFTDDRRYKPIKICEQLKECDKDQSPIEFRNIVPPPPLSNASSAAVSDFDSVKVDGGGVETSDYVF
jgi:hypothetical protein